MKSFWGDIKKPFFCVAPMHDITDHAFRRVIIECKKSANSDRPEVLYTEFVSIDGMTNEKSIKKIKKYYLGFSDEERPIVAQIWGNNPDKFSESAKIIENMGFDGVDINMGCPDKKVVSLGGGAGQILDQNNALRCIDAVRKSVNIPVSVKTRIGFDDIDLKWIDKLMSSGINALAVHVRTKKELSKAPAKWDEFKNISKFTSRKNVILIGNGDISSVEEGIKKAEIYGIDGIMVGRGILGNPWFFSSSKPEKLEDRLKILKLHADFFREYFDGIKSFAMLKKHVRGYVGSFGGAKKIREKIMNTKTLDEFISSLSSIV